jgi:hypothetical protein
MLSTVRIHQSASAIISADRRAAERVLRFNCADRAAMRYRAYARERASNLAATAEDLGASERGCLLNGFTVLPGCLRSEFVALFSSRRTAAPTSDARC